MKRIIFVALCFYSLSNAMSGQHSNIIRPANCAAFWNWLESQGGLLNKRLAHVLLHERLAELQKHHTEWVNKHQTFLKAGKESWGFDASESPNKKIIFDSYFTRRVIQNSDKQTTDQQLSETRERIIVGERRSGIGFIGSLAAHQFFERNKLYPYNVFSFRPEVLDSLENVHIVTSCTEYSPATILRMFYSHLNEWQIHTANCKQAAAEAQQEAADLQRFIKDFERLNS